MKLTELESIVKSGESHTLEFKKSTAQLSPGLETICAFLNNQGGTVLIGVTTKGDIIGQDVSDKTKQSIANELAKLEPPIQIDVQYVPLLGGKLVIVLQTKSGQHAPYVYDGRPYYREQSVTKLMPQHLYEQLLVKRGQLNHSWEEFTAVNYSIESLDHEEIRRTVKDGIDKNRIPIEVLTYSADEILRVLGLLKDGCVTNAAAVLYAKDLSSDYPQCLIRLARFRGTDKLADFMDNQRVNGNAFKIISEANNFLMRHLPIASFFEPNRFERIDKPMLPVLAVREALVNAISHRDYSNRTASISLAIFDDRLEIWNNGNLPPQLKVQDLKKRHESYPRNELIATTFYKRGWVEGWGIGTTRMLELCKENDVPEPNFEEYSGGLAVIFKFKESMGVTGKVMPKKQSLTERQEEILSLLRGHNSLSTNEVRALIQNPPTIRTINIELSVLKKLGYVEQQGKARNTTWKAKQ